MNLRYSHSKAKQTVVLLGKGICFDTGDHNLKPARYMHNMHEDMNGSAGSTASEVAGFGMAWGCCSRVKFVASIT